MVPTTRLIRFIALGSPLWLLSFALPAGWLFGTSYLCVLALAFLVDYRSIPVTGFEINREFGRFSIRRN